MDANQPAKIINTVIQLDSSWLQSFQMKMMLMGKNRKKIQILNPIGFGRQWRKCVSFFIRINCQRLKFFRFSFLQRKRELGGGERSKIKPFEFIYGQTFQDLYQDQSLHKILQLLKFIFLPMAVAMYVNGG